MTLRTGKTEETLSGVVAHHSRYAVFGGPPFKDCKGAVGTVSQLSEQQEYAATLVSWLWEHDF